MAPVFSAPVDGLHRALYNCRLVSTKTPVYLAVAGGACSAMAYDGHTFICDDFEMEGESGLFVLPPTRVKEMELTLRTKPEGMYDFSFEELTDPPIVDMIEKIVDICDCVDESMGIVSLERVKVQPDRLRKLSLIKPQGAIEMFPMFHTKLDRVLLHFINGKNTVGFTTAFIH